MLLSFVLAMAFAGCAKDAPLPEPDEPGFYRPDRPLNQRPAPSNPAESFETGGGGHSMAVKEVFFDRDGILVEQEGSILTMRGRFGSIQYDVQTGYAQFFRPGQNSAALIDVYTEMRLNNPAGGNEPVVRTPFLTRDRLSVYTNPLDDGFGRGVRVTVESLGGMLIIFQNFYIYTGRDYLVFDAAAELANGTVRTNYIAALRAGRTNAASAAVSLTPFQPDRSLFVPYDNDTFVRFNARSMTADPQTGFLDSCEVSAIYHNASRQGIITGSISHDTWKSAVRLIKNNNIVTGLSVFAGYTSFQTRDTPDNNANSTARPHGFVSAQLVRSPKIFFGFYDDWRDGMEEYGRANGIVAPPLHWPHGVPFGWNSWAAHEHTISYDMYVNTSEFIKEFLPDYHNGDDAVYVNFDSFWMEAMPTEQMRRQAAQVVGNNGQIPGIYHTPFTAWEDSEDWLRQVRVEGASQYTMHEIVLRDHNGNLLPYLGFDSNDPTRPRQGWALDPTHPGTIAYFQHRINQFLNWGFRFVKLDFLSHGTMEGDFFDKSITTGKQAYNFAMGKMLEGIGPQILDRGHFFISLSIAPIFPSQYAHARRISCDVFGRISGNNGSTEYMLNSLTYGWWIHDTIYPYNDPDHIVIYRSRNANRVHDYNEGLSAYIAAAITGGLMLFSDDISVAAARTRIEEILNNESINKLVADGRTFRPVEGNTSSESADLFIRDDREINGNFYIAAFNFNRTQVIGSKTMTIDFSRIGLDPGAQYTVFNMITENPSGVVNGPQWTMPVMSPAEPRLLMLRTYTGN